MHSPAALPRQRSRIILAVACLCFFAIGTAMAAIGPALPELAAHAGSKIEAVGTLFSAVFLGALLAQLAAGQLSDRVDLRLLLLAGMTLFGLGTLGYATSRMLPLTLACALLAGLGQGTLIVGINIALVRAFAERSTTALNLANVFFGAGNVAGPALAVLSLRAWGGAAPVLGLGAALILIPIGLSTLIPRFAPPTRVARPAGAVPIYRAPLLWGLGMLLLVYVGTEISLSGWTTTYLQRTTALDARAGALVTAGFWLALTVGRVIGVLLSARIAPNQLLQLCLSGALIGGLLLALGIGSAPITIAAVLLIGLCFGPIFPTVIAISAHSFGEAQGRAVSIVSSLGSLGGILLPWLQGLLLARSGPIASTLLVIAGMLAMLALHAGRSLARRAAHKAT
ncbi:MAG: MFS transporter [Kouleothrix sp.]|jgi:fucose permease|nr:MFS transporter [Kouleothrix sp.]